MRRYFASLLGTLLVAGAASACLNDSELPGHEREFRSSYKRQAPPPAPSDSYWLPTERVPLALYGAGGLFALGAGVVIVRRPSFKN